MKDIIDTPLRLSNLTLKGNDWYQWKEPKERNVFQKIKEDKCSNFIKEQGTPLSNVMFSTRTMSAKTN